MTNNNIMIELISFLIYHQFRLISIINPYTEVIIMCLPVLLLFLLKQIQSICTGVSVYSTLYTLPCLCILYSVYSTADDDSCKYEY